MYLETKALCRTFGSGNATTRALDEVSVCLDQGEIGVILGPSGSGKSTLMNVLGGIERADSGEAWVDGTSLTTLGDARLTEYRREKVGFVFQGYNLIPHLTVRENIEVIEQISRSPLNPGTILDLVGLGSRADSFPRNLSGGEQQRVAIARAVVKNPGLLLCDELTGALDFESAIEVLGLIRQVNREYGTTVLIVTHNSAIAAMANRVYRFRSGRVTEATGNPTQVEPQEISW